MFAQDAARVPGADDPPPRLWHNGLCTQKTLKLGYRVGDLNLLKTRKRYTSKRKEKENAKLCSFGEEKKSITYIVRAFEMHEIERVVLERSN